MTTLLYTLWIMYTVGTFFFFLFWGTLFIILLKGSKDCKSCRKVTKLPKKQLLLEIDESNLRD